MTTVNKLKKLLNWLISLGWKPRGLKPTKIVMYESGGFGVEIKGKARINIGKQASLRDLVSLESGLWQFVCEKGLYDTDNKDFINRMYFDEEEMKYINNDRHLYNYNYEFWIMLSSIQENIEQFLLSSISTEGAKN